MFRIIFFSAIVVLAGGGVPAASGTDLLEQSGQRHDELAEADRLSVEVVKLFKSSEFEEAVPLAKRALKIRQKHLNPNDALIADAQSNLAELYLVLEQPKDAESLIEKAVKIYQLDSAAHGKSLAHALEGLGLLRDLSFKRAEAEALFLQALALRERVMGPAHIETKDARDRLATFYMRTKEFAKALPILRQQVAESEQKYGSADPRVGQVLERLSCALFRNKETAEAEKIEARANRILYADGSRKNEPLVLSQESFECRLITNPRPDFVNVARNLRFMGRATIIVALDVNETGQVTHAQVVLGEPLFREVSEKAALGATLRPLVVDGQAVKFKGTISHQFGVMTTTRIVAVPGVMRRP